VRAVNKPEGLRERSMMNKSETIYLIITLSPLLIGAIIWFILALKELL